MSIEHYSPGDLIPVLTYPAEQVERICISVNTVCNLGCEYCYFFHPENRVEKEPALSSNEIFSILQKSIQYHLKFSFEKKIKINFVGSGEPLIHWKNIRDAVRQFHLSYRGQQSVKFYMVTNATLVTPEIARELKELNIIPSVSVDGPKWLHDKYRFDHQGKGTFQRVMRGINRLRDVGFDITINTTLSHELLDNVNEYIQFVVDSNFKKIIFDRLVDVPSSIKPISYASYYEFLQSIHALFVEKKLNNIEIGNLEAYRRNFSGKADKVCTMFGGSCGAGTNFVIYMGRDVYPCGRMFGKKHWQLGSIEDDIEKFTQRMGFHIPDREDCKACPVADDCVRDCLLEYHTDDYNCDPRADFLRVMKGVL